jgi:hypothetical protein
MWLVRKSTSDHCQVCIMFHGNLVQIGPCPVLLYYVVALFESAIDCRLTAANLSCCGVICMRGYDEDEDDNGAAVVCVCVDRERIIAALFVSTHPRLVR